MNKTLKVMTSAALLAGVVAPVAVTTAHADSKNLIVSTPSIADDTDGVVTTVIVREDNVAFTQGHTFRVVLPEGVKWGTGLANNGNLSGTKGALAGLNTVATYTKVSDTVMEVTVGDINNTAVADDALTTKNEIQIPVNIKVDGATGPVNVQIQGLDSTVTSGSYTVATVGTGKTTATIGSVKTVGQSAATDNIQIDETSIGSMGYNQQTLTLKLPNNFNWTADAANVGVLSAANTTVKFAGGLAGSNIVSVVPSNNTLTVTFVPAFNDVDASGSYTPAAGENRTARGTVYIAPTFNATSSAQHGDVAVAISGTDFTDADLVVGNYADYGVTTKVAEVKELVAGKVDSDIKTAKITIEEKVTGSLINNRNIEVELPSWVKIVGVPSSDWNVTGTTFAATRPVPDGKDNKLTIPVTAQSTAGSKGKIEFKVELSVEAGKTGDIEAKITGAGMEAQTLVVAKAVNTVSVESTPADAKIGIQDQAVNNFTLVEAKKGQFERSTEVLNLTGAGAIQLTNGAVQTVAGANGTISVEVPAGVSFSSTPTLKVVDGNGEVENATRGSFNGGVNNRVTFNIKSESTKPVKVEFSDVKLSIDRTVAEGPVEAKVTGSALVENNGTNDGQFNTATAAKFVIANVTTPAPGKVTVDEVKFGIGSTTYTVGKTEKTMDVAPFVEAGRTYMPIRYVAEAVGVNTDSIFWDQATQTATLIKGDRVVQLTAGSKSLKVNGASISMDAAAKVKDGRTVLPVRFVGQALGATVDYDATAQTVTVK